MQLTPLDHFDMVDSTIGLTRRPTVGLEQDPAPLTGIILQLERPEQGTRKASTKDYTPALVDHFDHSGIDIVTITDHPHRLTFFQMNHFFLFSGLPDP
jgi:hypothetical protein